MLVMLASSNAALAVDSESIKNRSDARMMVTTGVGVNRSFAEAGVYVNKDDLIGLQYSNYENGLEGETKVLALGYTLFNGNSFYWWNGIGYRQVEIRSPRGFGFLTPERRATFQEGSYSDISWDSGIGNRWQWKSFTLGCEWLGFYMRGTKIAHKLDDESDANAAAVEKQRQMDEEDPGRGNFRFLTIHAGVSF